MAIQQLFTVKTRQKQRLEEISQKKEEEPELFYLAPKQSHHVDVSLFVKFLFSSRVKIIKKNLIVNFVIDSTEEEPQVGVKNPFFFFIFFHFHLFKGK